MNKNMFKKTVYAVRDNSDSDSDNNAEAEVWCICRSSDSSRFMIACDCCEEWYHGDCVNITPKLAESISKYFCTWCQKKNPSLKVLYKPGTIMNRPKEKFDKVEKFDKMEKFEKVEKFDKVFKSEKIERYERLPKIEKTERPIKLKIEEKLMTPIIKHHKMNKSFNCGECMGCLRKVDCMLCQNCKTKTGLGCIRRMCQKRQAQIAEKLSKPQEKMMLTKLPTDFIPTKSAPPKKAVVTKPLVVQPASPTTSSSSVCSEPVTRPLKRPISPSSSTDSDSILSSNNRKKTYVAPPVKKSKFPDVRQSLKPPPISQPVSQTIPQHSYRAPSLPSDDSGEEEDDDEDDVTSDSDKSDDSDESYSDEGIRAIRYAQTKPIKKPQIKSGLGRPVMKKRKIITTDAHRGQRHVTRKSEPESVTHYKSAQCYNIGCSKSSRMGSKYCSDECGISLAEQRLLKYLPERIVNWNNLVSISEKKDKKLRSEIKKELQTIHYNLAILNASHQDLTEFIDRWRSTYSATASTESGTNEDSVQCVTCDMMVNSVKALAHMENCYQKIEGQTMVFADFEDVPIGTKLFCDYYDNNTRGYCKRLAALCDHNKDPKVDPKTICAFPLSVNEKSDKVCMTAKIKCSRHINWERIQRAVIDMNRFRLLVQYGDLQMDDKRMRQSLSQRGGVMAILTHETIDHQPLKPMLPYKDTDDNKCMKKFTQSVCI